MAVGDTTRFFLRTWTDCQALIVHIPVPTPGLILVGGVPHLRKPAPLEETPPNNRQMCLIPGESENEVPAPSCLFFVNLVDHHSTFKFNCLNNLADFIVRFQGQSFHLGGILRFPKATISAGYRFFCGKEAGRGRDRRQDFGMIGLRLASFFWHLESGLARGGPFWTTFLVENQDPS